MTDSVYKDVLNVRWPLAFVDDEVGPVIESYESAVQGLFDTAFGDEQKPEGLETIGTTFQALAPQFESAVEQGLMAPVLRDRFNNARSLYVKLCRKMNVQPVAVKEL